MSSSDEGETTRRAGSPTSDESGSDADVGVAPQEDAERTVVVPRRPSHDDEERTVVAPRPEPVFDDPERTVVAPPTSSEPQRLTGTAANEVPLGRPSQSAPERQDGHTAYRDPDARQRASPPLWPPSPQHGGAGLTPGYPGAGQPSAAPPIIAQQHGFPPPPHYGQPNPYGFSPPGPYGAPPYGPLSPAGRGRFTPSRALLWGGLSLVVVVLVVGVVIGLSKPGFVFTKKLDVQGAQAEIQRVLTDDITGYGDKNVADVKCNNGANITVKQGASFTCQVNIDGAAQKVTATFLDNSGNYEVGRPD